MQILMDAQIVNQDIYCKQEVFAKKLVQTDTSLIRALVNAFSVLLLAKHVLFKTETQYVLHAKKACTCYLINVTQLAHSFTIYTMELALLSVPQEPFQMA